MYHHLSQLSYQRGLDGYFPCYTTLDHLPQQAYALYLLRRCAYIIAPIMRRHSWSVPMLHELSPYSSCHGKCQTVERTTRHGSRKTTQTMPLNIELRLREDDDPSCFIAIHHLTRTMLHELSHLVYKRHFVGFYRFNAQLLSELVRDVEKGELRKRISWKNVPDRIAGTEEIVCTMTGDLKKSLVSMIAGGKKDRRRHWE
ncbi:unnamed protein product [Alternaria alternata]